MPHRAPDAAHVEPAARRVDWQQPLPVFAEATEPLAAAPLSIGGTSERPRTPPMGVTPGRGRRQMAAAALEADLAELPAAVPNGTLRMLPGRLEVVAGLPTHADIRFVQTGSAHAQRVTLGRKAGELYEHVQIVSPTVSRLHAAIDFAEGRWSIENLSDTNPLRVNGAELERGGPPLTLSDGDTVELGEVTLRFRG